MDILKASVRHESLWNAYALFCLVIFQNGCHDAWEGESRTVECVTELHLLVSIAVATLESIGLISVKVGNRRHLQPASLSLGIHLEVIADGRSETLVAAAETEYTVWQLELLQQSFDMVEHLLMAFLRMFWRVDAHYLYLRELVKAVETSHVLAVRTSLATETLSVCTVLDGQQD